MQNETCTCCPSQPHRVASENAADAVISVNDVCFAYGAQEVLHNVSFAIPKNAMVAVVGPNGGGKTTLLRLILGDLAPRYGTVSVLGKAPEKARKKVGLVPQQITFDPTFPISILEAVMLGCAAERMFGWFTREEKRRALEALRAVGLADVAGRNYAEVSGGQRQRVLVAQALCSEPEILLLDEPTANVDTQTEHELYALFKALNKTKTIIVVSHNLRVVVSHSTHILCVNRVVDMHSVEDEATRLTPLPGEAAKSLIDDAGQPYHMSSLIHFLQSPHKGEHAATAQQKNTNR